MATKAALKNRIRSVSSTRQITKAMELVSASKMRRAQESALKSRAYRNTARQILSRLRELTDVSKNPLFAFRLVQTRLIIVISSDRGLAGAYNSNILRKLMQELKDDRENDVKTKLIVVGKRAANVVGRIENINTIGLYEHFPEAPTANDIRPILTTLLDEFKKADVDAVDILYTDYKSSIKQEVTLDRLLPAAYESVHISPDLEAAVFEPSPQAVLDAITERLIEADLTQALYESQASEQSSRMLAMKNATDNANELVDDLTLAFNTARQAGITQELAEITGGAEAMK
jgi:F-type H+-transporting ATPase subunit gamma